MRSFLRQLNQYSFAKQPIDITSMSFSHPRFLRGRKNLLKQVQRRAPGEPAVTAESLGDEAHSKVVKEANSCNHHTRAIWTSPSTKRALLGTESSSAPSGVADCVTNGALTRASTRHAYSARRSNESSMQEATAVGSGWNRNDAIVRTSGRIIRPTAKIRAFATSSAEVAEEELDMEGSEKESEEENEFVTDSSSSVLAIKSENVAAAGIATAAKSMVKNQKMRLRAL